MDSIKGRLTRGAVWIGATRALMNLVGFVSTIALARLLSPDDFGLVALATTILAIASSVTELSLASALVHHADPTEAHFDTAFTLGFVRSALVGGVLCALASPVAHLYEDARLVDILLFLGATSVLGGLANPKTVLLSKNLIFWQEFALNVSQKVVGFLVAVGVAIAYRSYWSLILGSATAQLASVLLSYAIAPYRPRFRLRHAKELFSFSVWLSLGQAVNILNWKFDHLIVGYFVGKPALGVYTFADNLAALPTREATTPIAQTLFPGFAHLAGDKPRLTSAYQLAQSTVCAIALPVGVGFAAIAHPLLTLTVGNKWQSAVLVIQILVITIAFQTLATTLQPLAMAMGETKMLFRRDVLSFVIRIPFIIVGMLVGGLLGIVWARAISSAVGTLVNMELVKRLLHLPLRAQFSANSRALISVMLLGVTTFVTGRVFEAGASAPQLAFQIGAIVAVGFVTYIASMLTLWRFARRPPGPEAEAARVLAKLSHVLFHKREYVG